MPFPTSRILYLLAAGRLAAAASYTIADSYTNANFFEEFDFYSGTDPTKGFVDYQDAAAASSAGLAGYSGGGIYLGSDYQTANPANGRASTRVSSSKTYTKMLLVADVAHMPVGCGTWPALWTFGDNPAWPASGEIDMLEGVNSQTTNEITLHTSDGCVMRSGTQLASSKMHKSADCGASKGEEGCPQTTTSSSNFGAGLNEAGGGVYVMEWTSEAISVWFLPRNSTAEGQLSASLTSVDTSTFGTPTVQFVGGSGCNVDGFFKKHKIVINTTFCGKWAGLDEVWQADATCSALADTCQEYVANNPAAFTDAYWLLNYINVYTLSGNATSSSASAIKKRVERYRA